MHRAVGERERKEEGREVSSGDGIAFLSDSESELGSRDWDAGRQPKRRRLAVINLLEERACDFRWQYGVGRPTIMFIIYSSQPFSLSLAVLT